MRIRDASTNQNINKPDFLFQFYKIYIKNTANSRVINDFRQNFNFQRV